MLLRVRGNLDLLEPGGWEQNPLCHLSQLPQEGQEEHTGHRWSQRFLSRCAAGWWQAGAAQARLCVTRAPRAGLAHPLLCPVLYLSQGLLLIELGLAFCVSCHKQLILWRVLEGSEIHLE